MNSTASAISAVFCGVSERASDLFSALATRFLTVEDTPQQAAGGFSALFDPTTVSELSAVWLMFAGEILLKGLGLLIVAGLCWPALRRTSAAVRHLAWTATLTGLVALPVLSVLLPGWTVPVWPDLSGGASEILSPTPVFAPEEPWAVPPPVSSSVAPEDRPAAESPLIDATEASDFAAFPRSQPFAFWTWAAGLFIVWLMGALIVLAQFPLGCARLWWMTRRAQPVTADSWLDVGRQTAKRLGLDVTPPVRISAGAPTPLTWGIRRPVVLLPCEAVEWSMERLQIVLLHEFAHIKRRDCLTQLTALCACAIYWFNPLVWLVARFHRMDREHACDDCVLQSGARPSFYADTLLDIARSLHRGPFGAFAMVSMARRSQLEGRLLAVLDPRVDRRNVSRWPALTVVIGFVMVLPFAAAQPGGQTRHNAAPGQPVPSAPAAEIVSPAPFSLATEPARAVRPTRPYDRVRTAPEATLTPDEAAELEALAHEQTNVFPPIVGAHDAGNAFGYAIGETVGNTISTALSGAISTALSGALGQGVELATMVDTFPEGQKKDYTEEWKSLGYTDPLKLARFLSCGVTPVFIRQMKALGYERLSADELLSLKNHGITPAYIGQMKSAFKRLPSPEELVELRNHGITLEMVREAQRSFGADISIEKVKRLKKFGVTTDLSIQLENLGFARLSADQLVTSRMHTLTPEFIGSINALGYNGVAFDQLIKLRTQGVTPEYIEDMKELFGQELSLDLIVKMRTAGVTSEYVADMAEAGFEGLEPDKLAKAKLQGVTPAYIKALREQGYTHLTIDQYIRARIMGITPEFIAATKARGLRDLSIDQLVALKNSGILRE